METSPSQRYMTRHAPVRRGLPAPSEQKGSTSTKSRHLLALEAHRRRAMKGYARRQRDAKQRQKRFGALATLVVTKSRHTIEEINHSLLTEDDAQEAGTKHHRVKQIWCWQMMCLAALKARGLPGEVADQRIRDAKDVIDFESDSLGDTRRLSTFE